MSLAELVIHPDTVFIDVRTEDEYRQQPLPGSIHMPLDQVPIRSFELVALGAVPLVFYCANGQRSSRAVQYLRYHGFGNIYDGGDLPSFLQRGWTMRWIG